MFEGLLLEFYVGMKVNLGGFRRLVTEPEGDHRVVNAPTKEFHGGRVPQRVGRDRFPDEGRTVPPSRRGMLGDEALQAVGAEGTPAYTREKGIAGFPFQFGEPCRQDRNDIRAQRCTTHLSPFAPAAHMRSGAERHVGPAQRCDLAIAKACLDRQEQQRPVSPSDPSGGIRCSQKGLHLYLGKEVHGCPHVALGRNRKYPLAIEGVRWLAEGHIAEEGVKGCQSRVPGANGAAALVFEVVEERSQESLVEFLHTEIRGVPAEPLRCEA